MLDGGWDFTSTLNGGAARADCPCAPASTSPARSGCRRSPTSSPTAWRQVGRPLHVLQRLPALRGHGHPLRRLRAGRLPARGAPRACSATTPASSWADVTDEGCSGRGVGRLLRRLGASATPSRTTQRAPRACATWPARRSWPCRASSSTATRRTRRFHRYEEPWVQWGGPNPDNVYLRAPIDPTATYRVWADVTGRAGADRLAGRGRHAPRRVRRVVGADPGRAGRRTPTARWSSGSRPTSTTGNWLATDPGGHAAADPPVPGRLGAWTGSPPSTSRTEATVGVPPPPPTEAERGRRPRAGHGLGRGVGHVLARLHGGGPGGHGPQRLRPAHHAARRRPQHRLRRRLVGARARRGAGHHPRRARRRLLGLDGAPPAGAWTPATSPTG